MIKNVFHFMLKALSVLEIFKFLTEAVVQRCSVKKVFIEIPQNSQKNTVPESLF